MLKGTAVDINQVAGFTRPDLIYLSPTSGQTISFNNNSRDQILWLSPAAALASLTVNLPSDANSKIGQTIKLGTSQGITSLNLAGGGVIYNSASTLVGGEMAEYQKVAANTWVRL